MRGKILVVHAESLGDDVFSYQDDQGWQYHWNITKARNLAEARDDLKPISLKDYGITVEFIRSQYTNLDEAHAMTADLSNPLLFLPLEGKVCLADGWHRLYRAAVEGIDVLPAYFLTQEEVDDVLICTLPPGKGLDWGQPKPSAS
jgi:hypothetical protein